MNRFMICLAGVLVAGSASADILCFGSKCPNASERVADQADSFTQCIQNGQNAYRPAKNWNLLTKTQGGAISLIRDLTKDQCDHIRERVIYKPKPSDCPGCMTTITAKVSGNIRPEDAECFQ